MGAVAVIFDFDGVLVDTLAAHIEAWTVAVAAIFNKPLPPPETLIGHSTDVIANAIAVSYGDPKRADDLIRTKNQCLPSLLKVPHLLPGARDFLNSLKEKNFPHGIASNAKRSFVTGVMDAAGLVVPAVVVSDDVANPKPAPDVYLKCAALLGVQGAATNRVVVFEDSVQGVKAGVAAGMVTVGVMTHSSGAALMGAGAAGTCKNLAEAMQQRWVRI
jgi:HAD superfamily hydrolase (TIGR01509 family)